jgi:hypothetical protein
LDKDKLTFYADDSKKVAKKFILMSSVKNVAFHYDEKAPVVSKKLGKGKDNDESRFDIYTSNRQYMLKSDGNSLWESQGWVKCLEDAARKYNKNYNSQAKKKDSSDDDDSD